MHWPDDFSPCEADVFTHNEMVVCAPRSRIWRHLIDARKWPEWYPNSFDVRILNDRFGVLHRDSEFSWHTLGLHMDSKVFEFAPFSRLGWFSSGPGVESYHSWLLIPTSDGCRIVTEEAAKGPIVAAIQESDADTLRKCHSLWLLALKLLSER